VDDFEEAAERRRAEQLRQAVDKQWEAYAVAVHQRFVTTELPRLLADFWVAAQTGGMPSALSPTAEKLVLVGVVSRSEGPEERYWTDRRGRIWEAGRLQGATAFSRSLGWHPSLEMGVPLPMDADVIRRRIRTHYEDYLTQQLQGQAPGR